MMIKNKTEQCTVAVWFISGNDRLNKNDKKIV